MAHCIRLRGAWTIERSPVAGGHNVVRLTRQFGCSQGLKAAERVWLSIEDIARAASVTLNDKPLGKTGRCTPARFDVTSLLQSRNLLVIEITTDEAIAESDEPGCLGLVQLEID
jgi:hypothetical protein